VFGKLPAYSSRLSGNHITNSRAWGGESVLQKLRGPSNGGNATGRSWTNRDGMQKGMGATDKKRKQGKYACQTCCICRREKERAYVRGCPKQETVTAGSSKGKTKGGANSGGSQPYGETGESEPPRALEGTDHSTSVGVAARAAEKRSIGY